MKNKLVEAFGWYGTVAIIGAYGLSSFDIIVPQSLLYQFLNITGSIGLLTVAFKKKVYQAVVLNIIWAIIGLIAVYNMLAV